MLIRIQPYTPMLDWNDLYPKEPVLDRNRGMYKPVNGHQVLSVHGVMVTSVVWGHVFKVRVFVRRPFKEQ